MAGQIATNYSQHARSHVLGNGDGHDMAGKGHVTFQSIRIGDLNISKLFSSL